MLYLEDYLEVIEHLPIDLRERFTDMREMDLQVQNNMDLLDDKAKKLFNRCSIKKVKVAGADEIYEEIKTEYYKTLEDTDQKVHLANQIYDLVDRHLRKLDQELSKFKMELEADNPGITEVLEQRSLELDNSASQQNIAAHSHKERKRNINSQPSTANSSPSNMLSSVPEKKIKLEAIRNISDPVMPKQLDQIGKENLIISDNIMPEKDQRNDFLIDLQDLTFPQVSNSLKSGIELKSSNDITADIDAMLAESLDTSGEHISDSSLGSIPGSFAHRPSRTKKQTSKAAAWVQERMQAEARQEQRKKEHQPLGLNVVEPVTEGQNSRVEVIGSSTVEWTCDPNEPRYCICNQVSYGEMVGCDNEQCTIEWFHYGCVGLMEAPKGKWYCPQCTQTMKRRNKK